MSDIPRRSERAKRLRLTLSLLLRRRRSQVLFFPAGRLRDLPGREEREMKGTDKFLAAIVFGVVVLVIVSVVLVITRPPPSYKEDNSAENVAYNYLLALQEHNYARAYSYLSPSLSGYPPSVERFTSNLRNAPFPPDDIHPPNNDSVSLEIASSRAAVSGPESVEVTVRSTQFTGDGLFGPSQHSSLFLMELQRENGAWKIVQSDRYFVTCWTRAAGCP